jgi:hypothetical protein
MTAAPKGQMQLDPMVSQSVTGPVGLPTDQPIATHAPSQAVALGAGEPGREKKGTVASRDVTVGRRENRMGSTPATLPASVRTGRYALVAAIGLALLCGTAAAEEGGSGHYLPGSMASFVDGVPLKETFIARLNLVYYQGSIGAQRPLPIGGLTALGASASS